jgi:hypothetical protein
MEPPVVRPESAVRRVAAALLLALAARTAAAADPDAAAKLVQAAIDAIKAGDVAAAVTGLGDGAAPDPLAARPELVHVLCDRAFRYDTTKADPEQRRVLAARLFALATAAQKHAPADSRTSWALAEALVVRERAGPRTGPAAWTDAAELLEKVHAQKPADALPLAYGVGFLLEGACNEPDATVPLTKRADALAKKALDAQKPSPTLAVTIATSQFWAGRTLVASNRKAARGQVCASLASLEPFTAGEPRIVEAATLWNDVLAWAKKNGFVLEERFAMTPRTTLGGALAVDVPLSSRWSFERVDAAEGRQAYDYVTEMSPEGTRLRQVLFRRYVGDQDYTFEDPVPVGGDNVRAIAQGLQRMIAARVLAAGASTPAPERRPFHRDMDGYVFTATGRAAPEPGSAIVGAALRVTGYVMRGHNQACYAVLVYDYSGKDEASAEIEALVAGLKEKDR